MIEMVLMYHIDMIYVPFLQGSEGVKYLFFPKFKIVYISLGKGGGSRKLRFPLFLTFFYGLLPKEKQKEFQLVGPGLTS